MKNSRRIDSIDIVRGIVMIIMAIDHSREFFGAHSFRPEDVSQASPALFMTRMITHMCAPAFILLSGMSIYLRHQIVSGSIYSFVFKRGIWLIVVELVILSPIVTHGYQLFILGILWVIGLCMIFTSALIRLPRWPLILLALLMIAGHHLLPVVQTDTLKGVLLGLLYHTPYFVPTSPALLIAYTVVPWLGIMLLGYCLGPWFLEKQTQRIRHLILLGTIFLFLFTALRFSNSYGDPLPWAVQDRGALYTALSFINVTKYPASLLFISLTVGTTLILLALIENRRGYWIDIALTFGKVPFFFFVLHFFLLSISSVIWTNVVLGKYVNFAIASPADWPPNYQPSLLRVYVVWIIVMIVCYFPSRWFASYKSHSKNPWLAYL